MLKAYADIFKISEQDLTQKSLDKLKLFALLGLPATPLYALSMFGSFSTLTTAALLGLCFLSGTFLLITMLSKFTNRFWARDKYLDEWELKKKHHSMAVGLQITSYIIGTIMILALAATPFLNIKFTIGFEHIAMAVFSLICIMVYIPLLFLLWTTSPIKIEKGQIIREDKAVVTAREQKVEAAIITIVVGLILLAICAGLFAWGYMSAHHAAGH